MRILTVAELCRLAIATWLGGDGGVNLILDLAVGK